MQQKIILKLLPSEAASSTIIHQQIAKAAGRNVNEIFGYYLVRKSLDARNKNIWVNLTVNAFINEPFHERPQVEFRFQNVGNCSL